MKKEVNDFKDKFDKLFNNVIEKSIKKLTEDIRLNKTDHIHLIQPILLSIIKLRKEGYSIRNELDSNLKTKFNDIYYKIRIGSHRLAQLGQLSSTEITRLIQGEVEYIELEELFNEVDSILNSLEKTSKLISEYSFHYKNKLDWEKFNNGEN